MESVPFSLIVFRNITHKMCEKPLSMLA